MKNIKIFALLCLSIVLLLGFLSPASSGSARLPENKTLMQPQGIQNVATRRYEYRFSPWFMG